MTTVEQIILIILAVFLALFLLLAIITTVLVIRILKTVKEVLAKASQVITTAESAAEIFARAKGPMTVFHIIRNITEMVTKHKPRKE